MKKTKWKIRKGDFVQESQMKRKEPISPKITCHAAYPS